MEDTIAPSSALQENTAADICKAYQAELERKSDLQCQQNVVKSDIQMLTKDVNILAEVGSLFM